MSDVAEEAMDSSAVSDEEADNQQETSGDRSSSNKSLPKISGKSRRATLLSRRRTPEAITAGPRHF